MKHPLSKMFCHGLPLCRPNFGARCGKAEIYNSYIVRNKLSKSLTHMGQLKIIGLSMDGALNRSKYNIWVKIAMYQVDLF